MTDDCSIFMLSEVFRARLKFFYLQTSIIVFKPYAESEKKIVHNRFLIAMIGIQISCLTRVYLSIIQLCLCKKLLK